MSEENNRTQPEPNPAESLPGATDTPPSGTVPPPSAESFQGPPPGYQNRPPQPPPGYPPQQGAPMQGPPPGYQPPPGYPVQGPPPGYPAQTPPPSGGRFGRFKRPQGSPPGYQGPPPGYGQQRRPPIEMDKVRAQMGVARERTSAGLERAGIDVPTALKSLMLASIIGILAGFFGMVSPKHALIFAGAAIALNGFTYSFFKREEDIAGLTVSLASGLVAAIFWLILTAISGNDYTHTNFVQTIVFGLIFGLIGFGWLALLRALPEDLFANKTEPPSKPE